MTRTPRTWLLVCAGILAVAACAVGIPKLARHLLTEPTTAEEARDHVLSDVAPQLINDVRAAKPDPGDLGPAVVALFRERFARAGDPVLASGTAPGGPVAGATAGWIDVRMTRAAEPDGSLTSVRGDPVTLCLRFETVWTATLDARYAFHEIGCPPQAAVRQ